MSRANRRAARLRSFGPRAVGADGVLASTGGVVDAIYLGSDLDRGGLERDNGAVDCGDVRVEPLYLSYRVEAMHRLIESCGGWLGCADSGHGTYSILERSHAADCPRYAKPQGARRRSGARERDARRARAYAIWMSAIPSATANHAPPPTIPATSTAPPIIRTIRRTKMTAPARGMWTQSWSSPRAARARIFIVPHTRETIEKVIRPQSLADSARGTTWAPYPMSA